MTKKTVIHCILTLLLFAYIVVMWPLARSRASALPFGHVRYVVADSVHSGFVSSDDIRRECLRRFGQLDLRSGSNLRLNDLETALNGLPQIESANASVMSDGSLQLDIVPMQPVARVFDGTRSYYINRAGKKIPANLDYNLDVPVVTGRFDSRHTPARMLPVLDYIKKHDDINALVSSVQSAPNGDIYLIPVIYGHTVNFGDTTDIADKFARLKGFYNQVMASKGWDFYSEISVKWRGQVVGKRRFIPVKPDQPVDDSNEIDYSVYESLQTMPPHEADAGAAKKTAPKP